MSYKLTFQYNHLGFGALCIWKNDRIEECFPCRTGSINGDGKLVNAIPVGVWTAFEFTLLPASHREIEPSLFVKIGDEWFGFKLRLRTPDGAWSHYLIHVDGSVDGKHDGNGSDGCVVSLKRHFELCGRLSSIMKIMREMPVEVNK